MKSIKILFIIYLLGVCSNVAFAQKTNAWLTYGQSKFMYSPGIEVNHFINKHIGIQIGVNTYFQYFDPQRVTNITDDYTFNFYNTNLGVCAYILQKENHHLGVTAGFKIYYGPEYETLHYYEAGGYYIYFDSSGLNPAYGADFGIFYTFKKITGIIKFDTARNKIRVGLGYSFHRSNTEKKSSF